MLLVILRSMQEQAERKMTHAQAIMGPRNKKKFSGSLGGQQNKYASMQTHK